MTQDEIKKVKAIYSAKNKIKHTKIRNANDKLFVSKPFFSGLIEKLENKNKF